MVYNMYIYIIYTYIHSESLFNGHPGNQEKTSVIKGLMLSWDKIPNNSDQNKIFYCLS